MVLVADARAVQEPTNRLCTSTVHER